MAKKIYDPVNRLCDGFLKFRLARLNDGDFDAQYEGICGSPSAILRRNLMFLALNHRMGSCLSCQQPCNASNCVYSSELTFTAAEILQRWQHPDHTVLRDILNAGKVYIYTALLETCAENMDGSVRGEEDVATARDIRGRIFSWHKQRHKKFFDLLDRHSREQPVYLALLR
jgi:hypothetical protein